MLQFLLYRAIKPFGIFSIFSFFNFLFFLELVDAAWTKRDKYQRSPQLLKLIDHSNNVCLKTNRCSAQSTFLFCSCQLTYWVTRSIVETESLDERVEMLSRVLEIMTVFEELNNFNGIVSFFAALNCQPVYRLEESKSVSQKKKFDFTKFFYLLLSVWTKRRRVGMSTL